MERGGDAKRRKAEAAQRDERERERAPRISSTVAAPHWIRSCRILEIHNHLEVTREEGCGATMLLRSSTGAERKGARGGGSGGNTEEGR
jgi:hypothetical protein